MTDGDSQRADVVSDATEHLDAEHPWPGLLAFTEAGRSFFHGRHEEVEYLLRLLRRQRLTILYGRSGLGKTSLLKAGLFPRLREEQFLPIYIRLALQEGAFRPIEQVQNELAAQLHDGGVDVRRCSESESLWEYFHDDDTEFWDRRNRMVVPVLVFDQFEEIFTVGQNQPGLRAFLDELGDLVANRVPTALKSALEEEPRRERRSYFAGMDYKVVLSFREDYLAEFESLPRPIVSIGDERMRLTAMTGRQANEAILQPGGGFVAESVAIKIIAFVTGRTAVDVDASAEFGDVEVDPALLSLFCWQLNKRRIARGQTEITDDLLAGEKDQIIADFYRSALRDVADGTRLFIEEELITSAGYRDSRALEDATAQGVSRADIDRLIQSRVLLRREERYGTPRIEVAHDVLTPVISHERDRRRVDTELQRERAQRAIQERLTREADERARTARRRARWAWAAAGTFAVLTICASIAVAVALSAMKTAKIQSERAEQNLTMVLQAAIDRVSDLSYDFYAGRITVSAARANLTYWRDYLDTIGSRETGTEVTKTQIFLYTQLSSVLNDLSLLKDLLSAAVQIDKLTERLAAAHALDETDVRSYRWVAIKHLLFAHLNLGELDEAARQAKDVGNLLTGPLDPWRKAEMHADIGILLTFRHSAKEALRHLDSAAEAFGDEMNKGMLLDIYYWRALNHITLGNTEGAIADLDEAERISTLILEAEPRRGDLSRQRAQIELLMARVLSTRGSLESAEEKLEAARVLIESEGNFDPANRNWTELDIEYHIADLARPQRDWNESLANDAKIVGDSITKMTRDELDYFGWHELQSRLQLRVGAVRLQRREYENSLHAYRMAETTASAFGDLRPSFLTIKMHLAAAKFGIGDCQRAMGDYAAAWGSYQAGFAIIAPILESNVEDMTWQHDFAMAKGHGAAIRRALNDGAGADADLESAIATLTRLVELDPGNFEWRADLTSLIQQRLEPAGMTLVYHSE